MKVSMLVRPLVFVTLTAPLLAGCGGGGSGSPTAAPRSVSATLPDGLTGTLTEDRSTVAVGGTVTYTLTLANNTAQGVTYRPFNAGGFATQTGGGFQVLQVTGAQPRVVYPLTGNGTTGYLGNFVSLGPGQSVSGTFAVVGGSPSPGFSPAYDAPGQYQATAFFDLAPGASGGASAQETVTTAPLTVTVQ